MLQICLLNTIIKLVFRDFITVALTLPVFRVIIQKIDLKLSLHE